MRKFTKSAAIASLFALIASGFSGVIQPANAATATINAVSFKAPVFDSYSHTTGGGAWNDGSVTYDKGELLGTNYKCGDIASFLLELNTSATPTKQPAPYKAEIALTYTWDATGQSGTSLTPLTDASHLKVNTGAINNTYVSPNTVLGTGTGGTDSGMNTAGTSASVVNSGAVVTGNGGAEFTSGATKTVTFTVQNILAGANIVVRSDAVIHCKPNANPTGNMQAALSYINVTYPGAPEAVSAGNQTVNFRGVGNLGGLGSSLSVTKSISANGTDCSSTVSAATYNATSQNVRYCYTVTNTGNKDVTNIVPVDNGSGLIAAPGQTISLYASSSLSGSAIDTTYVLSPGVVLYGTWVQNAIPSGTHTNTLTVTSSAPQATATATVTVNSPVTGLAIIKSQTSANPANVGDTITYSLVVTGFDNGNVSVSDPNANSLTCPQSSAAATPTSTATNASPSPASSSPATLSVNTSRTNSSFTCTATHIVTSADYSSRTITNVASLRNNGNGSPISSNTVTTPISTPLHLFAAQATSCP
jgi:hypothetical protein